MRGAGFALLAIGLGLMTWAVLMNVSVPNPGGAEAGFPEAIANNDLMNQRLVLAIIGAGAFVSGWLALILDRLTAADREAAIAKAFSGQV